MDKTEEKKKSETVDRRIRKTRRVIKAAFIELLKEKKINEISVREISEKADLNRGTFYLHYKDAFDLLEQLEEELIVQLEEILNRYNPVDIVAKPSIMFLDLYRMIQENGELLKILMGKNGDLNFLSRIEDIVFREHLHRWLETISGNVEQTTVDVHISYTVSGCAGIVRYWLRTGLTESPEEMARLTESFILHGNQVVRQI